MRILLVYPNAKKEIISWGDMGAIAEPIALEYIGAAGRQDGHDVKLLDLRLHNDELNDTLLDFQPDVVGVTGYSMHVLRALDVCRIAKELVPGCKTVVGGHHATLEPEDFFEPQMDYVVVGEGTLPFRAILQKLTAGEPVAGIAGVWSRCGGDFVSGGSPVPFDIDSIPPPDRTLALEDRPQYYIDWMKPIALMRTTVGCPYRCSFCSLWRIMDGHYYKRDIERVVQEIISIPERFIFFVDDEPFVNSHRMKLLADRIAEVGIDKEFFSYCRIDSFLKDRDLMKQWYDIGLRRLLIGVETIFDHELKSYNKRQLRKQIVQGLEAAKELGISLLCNFIIHPSYTEKEFEEVVRFIKENGVEYPSFTIWTPIPGTGQSFNDVLERQSNGRPNWDYFDLQHPVIKTTLDKEEFMRQFNNLYQVFVNNYYAHGSPLTMDAFSKRDQAFQDPMVVLATRMFGIMNKQQKSTTT